MKDNIKKILTIIAIPVAGFILLNLTFILAAVIHTIFFRLFIDNRTIVNRWLPASRHVLFIIIILVLSWTIFKSKINDLFKAIFSMVPTAVILVTLGIFLYNRPIPLYFISGIFYGSIIFYLYKNKKPWFYYYSVSLVAVALLIMMILGIDI